MTMEEVGRKMMRREREIARWWAGRPDCDVRRPDASKRRHPLR